MTLEDFFTSNELENGLTTPDRVKDLLTILQNEKENMLKNIGEASQQWSTVATTIATTENKECLDLFVQLDGISFIDKWLNDAQKFINDDGNDSLEEIIIPLLRALEKLQLDNHFSMDSGIVKTMQGLLSHSSLVIQEKAKALCDRWTPIQDVDVVPTDVNPVVVSPVENDKEKNAEQMQEISTDIVQQEIETKEEIATQEIVMESEVEIPEDENKNSSSETNAVTGIISPLEDANEKQEIEPLDEGGTVEMTSTTEVDHASESATKTELMEDTGDKDEDMVDGGESQSSDHQNTTMEYHTTSGIGDSSGSGLQESPGAKNPKTTLNTESEEGGEDTKEDVGIESEDDSSSKRPSGFSALAVKSRDDFISKRPSDMELDYGMVDPLELARQVANEVEREVDSREESCSTSTDDKEQSTGGQGQEVSSGPGPGPVPGPSSKGSPSPAEPMDDVETHDITTTNIPEMDQEPAANTEKGFSGFDLNQEVTSEETSSQVDPVLTPISVVSASKAAAAGGLPVAPLQFEGTLGWKGSAATSAFRRIPEGEKTFSSSSIHNDSNQRLNHLDFDLNMVEGSEDKIEDFLSRDKNERLQLDLNSLGDGDAAIISLDWKRDGRVTSLRQNGPQSPSVSSSSSSMQPSFRNIDLNLNDHSTATNNTSLDNPFLGKLFNNKRDESVISIFGTQVEVNRKDNIPPPSLQLNGRILEPSVDFSLGRLGSGLTLGSSMPYGNLPSYGYGHNGFAMGPVYGAPGAPIPYMVDSRGSPIVPSIPPTFSQPTQPFLFNMAATGAPSGSNGAGPSRNNFDLNSGFFSEMGNRENNGGLRQFFNQNQASSSSVIGGKREEPDGGWELFPMNYKHQQPPWQ